MNYVTHIGIQYYNNTEDIYTVDDCAIVPRFNVITKQVERVVALRLNHFIYDPIEECADYMEERITVDLDSMERFLSTRGYGHISITHATMWHIAQVIDKVLSQYNAIYGYSILSKYSLI